MYFVAFILFLMENPFSKQCRPNNVGPDQRPHHVASDLGLHCLTDDPFTGFQVRVGYLPNKSWKPRMENIQINKSTSSRANNTLSPIYRKKF